MVKSLARFLGGKLAAGQLLKLAALLLTLSLYRTTSADSPAGQMPATFLPFVAGRPIPPTAGTEFRGVWVTRFDWTTPGGIVEGKIDEIVASAAGAGFNAILFQVRATADAYYADGLEPWAERVSGGQLGQPPDPFWDPLAYFVNAAHAAGLQLHAYMNVYPVWECGEVPDPSASPKHLYHLLQEQHGATDDKLNGLQWSSAGSVHCSGYQRATPASLFGDDHYVAIANDLINRYDIDGIHLDHIRYGGRTTSCDPVSLDRFGGDCFASGYEDWQRQQVNGTVRNFYEDAIVPSGRKLWLTAAVWPIHINHWGWPASQGYYDYYQDSKGWLAGGYIDGIMPMIYPADYGDCPEHIFCSLDKWETIVRDFQQDNAGRYIIAGIGGGYDTFAQIEARIAAGRAAGAAGHAIFRYDLLHEYFDDFAAGPYAEPAAVPDIPWHP